MSRRRLWSHQVRVYIQFTSFADIIHSQITVLTFFSFFCINMFSEKPGSADTGGFRMRNIMCGDTQDWEFCRRSTNAECYYCSLQGMNLTTEQTAVKGWEVKCNTRIWGVKICVPAHLDFCLTLQFILVFILALALLLCSVISWVSACINVSVGVGFFYVLKSFNTFFF